MRYAIKLAGKNVWIHDGREPLNEQTALEIARCSPHEVIIYRDDKPYMRHRPRCGDFSLIARERASH